MALLIQAGIACGLGYVGAKIFIKRREKHRACWLAKTDEVQTHVPFPRSTYTYIVRCWHEQTGRADHRVVRYAVQNPATGQRHGYTSLEALFEGLAKEFDHIQQALPGVPPAALLEEAEVSA